MIRIICSIAAWGCLLSAQTIQGSELYTITDLGAGSALGINSRGEVLATDPTGLPFLYIASHKQFLPQPSGGVFTAMALNDVGQVTGYVNYGEELNYDLAIYSNGRLTVMQNLSGLYPVAINDAGQITGDTVFTSSMFFYSNGVVTPIGTLPGYTGEPSAVGINSSGEVIGIARTDTGTQQGFIYSHGRLTPVVPPGGVSSTVDAINDSGEIAGVYYPSSTSFLGGNLFLHTRSGSKDLGLALNMAAEDEEDLPFGMNDAGDIVGNAQTTVSEDAWIYEPGKGFSDLNNDIAPNSGWSLFQAIGINGRGEIVGNGILNGEEHGFLLIPTCRK
jgi:probable HAF family extracellular repeat protein